MLFAATPAAAKPAWPWPSGTYGNVRTHEETGDMLGMEARFFERAGRRMVEFVWCEGWCNDVHVMPVTRVDRRFAFHYSQALDGRENARREMYFVASPVGRGLNIAVWEGREKLDEGRPQKLRRLARPYAIPFAKANGTR